MKIKLVLLFFLLISSKSLFSQENDRMNVIVIRGADYKDPADIQMKCDQPCEFIADANTVKFSMSGSFGEKNLRLFLEFPQRKGSHKIKLDKDLQSKAGQNISIEIFGDNPAVDKDVFEMLDKSDEGVIEVTELSPTLIQGKLSVKYFDSATAVKKLSANMDFQLRNE